MNIHQGGRSVVFVATQLPEHYEGLPERAWSKDRLLNLANDLLLGGGSQLPGYLDRDSVRRYLQIQRLPNCFSVYQIWGLLVLEQWLRRAAASRTVRRAA